MDANEAKELFGRSGVKLLLTTTYDPEANVKIEQGHSVIIKALIRACAGKVGDGPQLLPYACGWIELLIAL
mgnify:FL=1